MTFEENSSKIKKKKRQTKKPLPKNVFEVVNESGQTIERVDPNKIEKKVKKTTDAEPKPTFSERTTKRRRREWDAMNYEPFDITRGRDYERSLQRVATRGIVQLFNTVRKQQQSSSSIKKKDKKETTINKGEFLDMLKTIDSDEVSCKIMKKNLATTQSTPKTTTPVKWNVLQDDLMASVKDDDDDDDDDDD
ncbi:unnamed protein product [Adineta steineri]|uniref:RRP15-like protein n=1 Tax=Adineta steineri TaxID=433720 RepID=A0A815KUC0_9BILA|nr:unnamed protein product [Adineta steineri]CAF1430352.1 unnamed protein product [Adineta steineri]CAF3946094.1 unnamed protein product [Adineta steineri]CAF3997521.1 unnamed protein product [Adineta steineri]